MRRPGAAAAAAGLIALGLAACGAEATPPRPPDAVGVAYPEEYGFGDALGHKDWRAARGVLDQLEARFGGTTIAMRAFRLDAAADPAAVKAHYEGALAPLGWREWPLESQPREGWAFAFLSPKETQVVAFEALDARHAAGGAVPMNILSNLPAEWIAPPGPASAAEAAGARGPGPTSEPASEKANR